MNDSVIVRSLIFYKTDGYNDQYYQPYQLHITDSTLSEFTNIMANATGAITPSAMAPVAASSLILDNAVTPVAIHNGWATPRLMFLLTVESCNLGGITEILEIQGYTDYYDPSVSQALANDAILTINNIIVKNTYNIPTSNVPQHQIKSSCQMLSSSGVSDDVYSVTPVDGVVAVVHDETHIPNSMYQHSVTVPGNKLSPFSVNASTRNNLSPATWLSSAINAHSTTVAQTVVDMEAIDTTYTSHSDEAVSVYSNTANEMLNAVLPVTNNAFIKAISNVSGASGATFTWGDLKYLDPQVDDKTDLMTHNEHRIVESEYQTNTSADSLASSLISQVSSAILHRLAIADVSYAFNNFNIAEPELVIMEYTPMSGAVSSELTTRLYVALLSELVVIATRNNTTIVNAAVTASVLLGTSMDVSVNHDAAVRYCRPAYADSINSGVVSNVADNGLSTGTRLLFEATDMNAQIRQGIMDNTLNQAPGDYIV